jgi:hypothetical protein
MAQRGSRGIDSSTHSKPLASTGIRSPDRPARSQFYLSKTNRLNMQFYTTQRKRIEFAVYSK